MMNKILTLFLIAVVLSLNVQSEELNLTPPPLSLEDLTGQSYQLDTWAGKTVLINFWATYCVPCRQEIRDLIILQNKYRPDNFQVVGIGVNDEQSIHNMGLLLGINYPVLLANMDKEQHKDILINWGNKKQLIPYTVLINEQGKIVYQHLGALKKDEIETEITRWLEK